MTFVVYNSLDPLGKIAEGNRLGLPLRLTVLSPSSSKSFGCWASWLGLILRPHTHGNVPVVCATKCRSGEYGNVYPRVFSLLKSPLPFNDIKAILM